MSLEEALAWRLFNLDIETLLSMRSLWKDRPERKEPNPLTLESLKAGKTHAGTSFCFFCASSMISS